MLTLQKDLVAYASQVYKHTLLAKDALLPKESTLRTDTQTKQSITHQDEEVPWLRALRERIERTLKGYVCRIIHVSFSLDLWTILISM